MFFQDTCTLQLIRLKRFSQQPFENLQLFHRNVRAKANIETLREQISQQSHDIEILERL